MPHSKDSHPRDPTITIPLTMADIGGERVEGGLSHEPGIHTKPPSLATCRHSTCVRYVNTVQRARRRRLRWQIYSPSSTVSRKLLWVAVKQLCHPLYHELGK